MFFFKRRRRNRIADQPFPSEWLKILETNVPLYHKLPDEDQRELQRHILIFIAEKRFEGMEGLEITDEIRVTIAAQACFLLLHRQTDYYPGLRSILVYPGSYVSHEPEYHEGGIVSAGPHHRLGESWDRGPVVLSWDDVRQGASEMYDGENVVFHEFAHQLDSSGGKGDSSQVFEGASNFAAWARVLEEEYEQFSDDIEQGRYSMLNEYGATNSAEFFAVATEYFFERSTELKRYYPRLYAALEKLYQQDPGEW